MEVKQTKLKLIGVRDIRRKHSHWQLLPTSCKDGGGCQATKTASGTQRYSTVPAE